MGSGRNDGDWRDNRDQRGMHDDARGDRFGGRGGGGSGGSGGERGFFERAGDEISSWFGDDEAERRREMDERGGGRSSSDYDRDRPRGQQRPGEYGRDEGREHFSRPGNPYPQQRSSGGERHGRPPYRESGDGRPYMGRTPEFRDMGRAERPHDMSREQSDYRPMTGDYGRFANERENANYAASAAASAPAGGVTSAHDRHYSEWRQRQIDDLDRDYEDYRREHQSKFESDFSNWRSTRQAKRQMLGSIKEHMQVVGSDDHPLGTVDKVRGDRIILSKADSGDGQHHSLGCALIDRVEADRVILDRKADEAKALFGSEERDRALFERDDNREPGAHILNRSFSGTY